MTTMAGLRALNARMAALGGPEATKIGQSANRASAVFLAKQVRAAAPVGPDTEGSIRTRHAKSGKTRQEQHHKIVNSIKVRKTRSGEDFQVQNAVTSGAYQSSFVEFGARGIAPNRFMGDTIEANKAAALDIMAKILERRLVKAGA